MSIQSYKDLIVWQKSRILVKNIYSLIKILPKEEKYGITDQLRRAAISVIANIAEGKNRQSKKEFIQFLYIAFGSCAEIEAILTVSMDLGFFTHDQTEEAMQSLSEVQKMLFVMIKKLKQI